MDVGTCAEGLVPAKRLCPQAEKKHSADVKEKQESGLRLGLPMVLGECSYVSNLRLLEQSASFPSGFYFGKQKLVDAVDCLVVP